jgi:organic radical activating enzyme
MPESKAKTEIQVPITVIVTDYCNRMCGPCSESATNNREKAEFLNLDLLTETFARLQGGERAPLMFSGGEPYLHPGFGDGFTAHFLERFKDIIICTNGGFTPLYVGEADYEKNASFRKAVDRVKEKIRGLIHDEREKIVRLSLSANHYLPLSDISKDLKTRILEEAGVSEDELLQGDDFHRRVNDEKDPLVRVIRASYLDRRIKVLKEADRQLRAEYRIWDKHEAILYFVVAGAGLTPDIVEKNQDAVMRIFGIEERLARRSPIFRYGHASEWPNAQPAPISKEPELVLRPLGRDIVVYASKYESRIDKRKGSIDQAIGIVQNSGDLDGILRENPKLTDPNTKYDKVYK